MLPDKKKVVMIVVNCFFSFIVSLSNFIDKIAVFFLLKYHGSKGHE